MRRPIKLLREMSPALKRWFLFAVIVCVPLLESVSAQACSLPKGYDLPQGYELVNSGKFWNALSKIDRSFYLIGFVDGESDVYLKVMNDIPPARLESLRSQTATMYDNASIRDVMTNLYSDPANTYIKIESMIYIARDKLSGKDVEPLVRNARENDCVWRSSK